MIIKRVLTRKSKLGIGKYKKETIDKMLKMHLHKALISIYYKISSIDFQPDILKELRIEGDWVLNKPSTDREKYVEFLKYRCLITSRDTELNRLKKKRLNRQQENNYKQKTTDDD